MDQDKSSLLIRFVLGREPTDMELEQQDHPDFDYGVFRMKLLLSDECLPRWPQMTSFFRNFVQRENLVNNDLHKIAHDIAVIRSELDLLQTKLDSLQPNLLDLLQKMDRAADFFADIKSIQASLKSLEDRHDDVGRRFGMALDLHERVTQ